MSEDQIGITYKQIPATLIVSKSANLKERQQLPELFSELKEKIRGEFITGPAFCQINFITSLTEGYDADIGFPVSQEFHNGPIKSRLLPARVVLSFQHQGSLEGIGDSYRQLYGFAYEQGLISDEFCFEIYHQNGEDLDNEIELQFVIHNWNGLFAEQLERVLGEIAASSILEGKDQLAVFGEKEERYRWVLGAVEKLEVLAEESERYAILSKCAHVFPQNQLDKLRDIYKEAREQGREGLEAVDEVISFMETDPGWGEKPRREGREIYSSKNPRDPVAYEAAETDAERNKAYCFCPVIRDFLDQGLSSTYCYCGSGWYRQQWENAIGAPVNVEIIKSILRGDELCEFRILLPEDL
jgi:effector-binding domain-containing protein